VPVVDYGQRVMRRRLAYKEFHPICHRATLDSFEVLGTSDRIGDCVDGAISGPLNAITAVASRMRHVDYT
jgi:hypothetical protein